MGYYTALGWAVWALLELCPCIFLFLISSSFLPLRKSYTIFPGSYTLYLQVFVVASGFCGIYDIKKRQDCSIVAPRYEVPGVPKAVAVLE
jgi:hypothetical protein